MEYFKTLTRDEASSDYSVSQPSAVFKALLTWTAESDASTMSEYMLKFKDETGTKHSNRIKRFKQ